MALMEITSLHHRTVDPCAATLMAGPLFITCVYTLEAFHTDGLHQAPWQIMLVAVVLLQLSPQPASTAAPSPTLSWHSSCFDCATSTIRSLRAMEVDSCIV